MYFLKNIFLLAALPFRWAFMLTYKTYFTWLLERKVKKAVRLSKLENRRYIVTMWWGRPRCIAKQNLKNAIKRRTFKKGTTIEMIEKHAYFVTDTGKQPAPAPGIRTRDKKY